MNRKDSEKPEFAEMSNMSGIRILGMAFEYIEENLETGAYNPLIYRFRYDKSESAAEFRKRIEEDLKFNLYHYLAMIGNCLDTLEIKKNKGIIENVVYFGLNRKTEEIVYQTDPDKRI